MKPHAGPMTEKERQALAEQPKPATAGSEQQVRERAEKAMAMIHALCQPRGSKGSREWIMSIPARPNDDPDIVIGEALRDIPKLLTQLAAKDVEWRAEKSEKLRWMSRAAIAMKEKETLREQNLKLQDDVAAIVSTHRSDWSWDDVLSDVRALKESSLTSQQKLTAIDALNDAIMLNEATIEGATVSQGKPPFTPEETVDLADELQRLPRFRDLLAHLEGSR